MVTNQATCTHEIKHRIAIATAACKKQTELNLKEETSKEQY
jgi:hypothetical protein